MKTTKKWGYVAPESEALKMQVESFICVSAGGSEHSGEGDIPLPVVIPDNYTFSNIGF